MMSTARDEFQPMASMLKSAREEKGLTVEQISRKTRLSKDVIFRLEGGDFDFTTQVFITGYLKTLSDAVGLNGSDLVGEYNRIRQKLHFVSEDMYAVSVTTVVMDGESLPEIAPERITDPTEMLTLDEKVAKKLKKEKRLNQYVNGGGAVLGVLCIIFLLLDQTNQSSEPVFSDPSESAREIRTTAPTNRLRKKWQLSDPILSEQERIQREALRQKSRMDSLDRARFLKSERVTTHESIKAISVLEAAQELEERLSGSLEGAVR